MKAACTNCGTIRLRTSPGDSGLCKCCFTAEQQAKKARHHCRSCDKALLNSRGTGTGLCRSCFLAGQKRAVALCRVCHKAITSSSTTGLCLEHARADPEVQARRINALKAAWRRPEGAGRPGHRIPVPPQHQDEYRALRRQRFTASEAATIIKESYSC